MILTLMLLKKLSNQYEVDNLSFAEILGNSSIDGVVFAVPAPLHFDGDRSDGGKKTCLRRSACDEPVRGGRNDRLC